MTDGAAVVTGASAGIGRGIARRLALGGQVVLALARRTALLDDLAAAAEREGGTVVPVPADLQTREGQLTAVDAIRGTALPVSVVVNNAGGSHLISAEDPEPAWETAMSLQFHAVRRLTDALVPQMKQRNWGRIVNIGAPLEPPMRMNGSTVAKAAVTMWAKMRSAELAPFGITVNTIAPGRILSEQVMQRLHPSEEERSAFARDNVPLGYLGEPADVAGTVAFLISDDARYITGELIHVDGGLRRSAW